MKRHKDKRQCPICGSPENYIRKWLHQEVVDIINGVSVYEYEECGDNDNSCTYGIYGGDFYYRHVYQRQCWTCHDAGLITRWLDDPDREGHLHLEYRFSKRYGE